MAYYYRKVSEMGDQRKLVLSSLGHTWILDLDGTIVKHNGYKIDGKDTFLPNAKEFLQNLPVGDMLIFLTSRTEQEKEITEALLADNNINYHTIIYNVPYGERILINDKKPSGLTTAIAISEDRDRFGDISVQIDKNL